MLNHTGSQFTLCNMGTAGFKDEVKRTLKRPTSTYPIELLFLYFSRFLPESAEGGLQTLEPCVPGKPPGLGSSGAALGLSQNPPSSPIEDPG